MDERSWIRLLPWRQKDRPESKAAQIKFRCELAFTRDSGGDCLELALVNRSSWSVWVEGVQIGLSDLRATGQTTAPSMEADILISQFVESKSTLSVNLVAAIYDAAGRPLRHYSCVAVPTVYYSVFDDWSSVNGKPRRVMMRGYARSKSAAVGA